MSIHHALIAPFFRVATRALGRKWAERAVRDLFFASRSKAYRAIATTPPFENEGVPDKPTPPFSVEVQNGVPLANTIRETNPNTPPKSS
jgi:hypothetical protein